MGHSCYRVCVSMDEDLGKELKSLSKKKHQSISGVIVDLVREALDFREDAYLSRLADEVEERAKDKTPVSAEDLWKELGIK